MAGNSNKGGIICLLYLSLQILIPAAVMSQNSQCSYNETLTKGRILVGKTMDATLSFYAFSVFTIHSCHHACQYNCRCISAAYSRNNDADTNSCLLFDFNDVTQYLKNDTFANLTIFEVREGLEECPGDCMTALESSPEYEDSIYSLVLQSSLQRVRVVCDMETDGGGWTLLQRRYDGSVDFYRDWSSYKNGFGDLNGEFWLGLDTAHKLMKDGRSTLRFDLWNGGEHRFAKYYKATIANESENYRLRFIGYFGNAGDSMAMHNNMMFSTKEKDNDLTNVENCAEKYGGAWWYNSCHHVNLNGMYGIVGSPTGINWFAITDHYRTLSKTEIKIKEDD